MTTSYAGTPALTQSAPPSTPSPERRLGDTAVYLSPLRYPGGKNWLVPDVRHWLAALDHRPAVLVEPFAGGGAVSLDAVANRLVQGALMVERDEEVAALWHTMLGPTAQAFAERIAAFELTPRSYAALHEGRPPSSCDAAFRTLVRNRAARGGVLAPGAGTMRSGENGRGLGSRWYPGTLAARVHAIAAMADRLTFRHGDAFAALGDHASNPDAVFFIDPPYSALGKSAGRRLYRHWQLDHERLFAVADALTGPFLMTYDRCLAVEALAARHGFDIEPVGMRNAHHAQLTELVIGRDLDAFRRLRGTRLRRLAEARTRPRRIVTGRRRGRAQRNEKPPAIEHHPLNGCTSMEGAFERVGLR